MPYEAIKIVGLDKARSAFRRLGVPAKEMSQAAHNAGLIVLREANLIVPVKTGKLKRTLRSASLQRGVVVRAGNSRVPYANPIHWGWFRRHIMPNPFFAKVLGYKAEEIYQTYFEQINKALDKARTNTK